MSRIFSSLRSIYRGDGGESPLPWKEGVQIQKFLGVCIVIGLILFGLIYGIIEGEKDEGKR